MVSSILLNNMMNPQRANAGENYRKGGDHALARRIKEADKIQQAQRHKSDLISAGLNQAAKRFDNTQAPIRAGERTAAHDSNMLSAGVNRESSKASTKKMIQDIAHDKSQRQIKDTFVSLEAASKLPYEEQEIFLDNLIEDYDGHGRLGTVFKYMKKANSEGRNKIFQELNDVGVKGGYLDELYASRKSGARPTNLGEYMANVRQAYIDDPKNNGEDPPAAYMLAAQERFQKISGSQAYERKFHTTTGDIDAKLTPEADELRDTEEIAESNKASSVDQAKQTVKDIASIHESISTTTSTIDNLTGIEEAIDDGAITGWASKFAPSLRAATLKLQNHAHRLGLDVIASVTFGALSEAELRLAMETAVPTDMAPQDLKKWVIAKKAAMKKFLREQQKMVIFLSNRNENTGVRNTKTDWLVRNQKLRDKEANNPNNPNVKKPNQPKTKPTQQHLNYYYTNPKNLSQEKLDRFFIDKFGKLPPTREVI